MASRSRVLITGISGFTGKHLAAHLEGDGWEVFGVTNAPDAERFPCLSADLGDSARIAEWIASVAPTHIVHLAALSHVVGRPLPFYEINVVGTESLLRAIESAGARPSKVVIASSANIYGQGSARPISEDCPPAPANHYAISKLAMEWVARQWFDRMPIIITRPFNYTGPGQSEAFLFAKLAGAFRRREPLIRLGNVAVARDLSDVSFVVEAYRRLLMSEHSSEMVNICSGRSVSIAEALAMLREVTGHEPEIATDPSLLRENDIDVLTGDPARLQAMIGPLAPIPLEEIFREMLRAGPASGVGGAGDLQLPSDAKDMAR